MSFASFVTLDSKDVKTTYSTSQGRHLGDRGMTGDGRSFAWALAGEALTTGIPITPAALGGLGTTAFTNINTTIDTWEPSSTSRTISLSTTWSTWGAIANEYADGWLVVEESTHAYARGQMVRVKSNTAGSTSTTDSPLHTVITFADDDYLKAGVNTGATIQVVPNEYFDVIENDGGASTTMPIVGVAVCEVADNAYFWAQTWGPCVVQQEGTAVLGELLVQSTDGLQGLAPLSLSTAATDVANYKVVVRPQIGWVLGPSSGDTDMGLVFLTIRP